GPQALGLCATDVAGCAAAVNASSERLLYAREVGDSGWIGTWAELQLVASQDEPFITMPFDVARIEQLNLCTFPIPVQNQFYEFLRFGFGRWPKSVCGSRHCAPLAAYDRGKFPLFSDVVPPNKKIRIYMSDPDDELKQVLLQSLDGNDQIRYSLDGTVQITGDLMTLVPPFVDSPDIVNKVIGIQKEITLGALRFYEVDTITADQRLVLTMQPGETTASYRRYFVGGIPKSCCANSEATSATEIQLTAI